MNCTEARARLADLLYGDLSPAERAAVENHLVGCAACRGERAALEGVRRLLDTVPAPAVQVDVATVYQAAADRQTLRARRWRRAAVALVGLAAALLLAALLRLEVRLEANQFVLRWGAAPEAPPAPPERVVVERVERPAPDLEERLRVLDDLLHALAEDVDSRDAQTQKDVARLRARLAELQAQNHEHWTETERNVAALYAAHFRVSRKGEQP
ncbi:MAG TPA: zf-HC2 domain-containing protein [Gemmataceae bacterium]|nr:zf-HC2 domain-containing protein [Gemmataceae bacterium]